MAGCPSLRNPPLKPLPTPRDLVCTLLGNKKANCSLLYPQLWSNTDDKKGNRRTRGPPRKRTRARSWVVKVHSLQLFKRATYFIPLSRNMWWHSLWPNYKHSNIPITLEEMRMRYNRWQCDDCLCRERAAEIEDDRSPGRNRQGGHVVIAICPRNPLNSIEEIIIYCLSVDALFNVLWVVGDVIGFVKRREKKYESRSCPVGSSERKRRWQHHFPLICFRSLKWDVQ